MQLLHKLLDLCQYYKNKIASTQMQRLFRQSRKQAKQYC